MKNIILAAIMFATSTMAFANVKVCGAVAPAESAGYVYGNYVVESGRIRYYFYSADDVTRSGKKVCVTGELEIFDTAYEPIISIADITKISVQK